MHLLQNVTRPHNNLYGNVKFFLRAQWVAKNVHIDDFCNAEHIKIKYGFSQTHNADYLIQNDVTVKGGQGTWKWHKQVNLTEYNHHAKFDVDHIYL